MQTYISKVAWEAMPKKPLNCYMLYREVVQDEVKYNNPGITFTELTQIISQMWTELEDADKQGRFTKSYHSVQLYKINYQDWLKKFELDEEKVKEFIKEKKEKGKRNKKGSKKVTKASKNDEEDYSEDERWIKNLKKKNRKQENPTKQQQEPKEKDHDKEKKADKDKKAEKEKKEDKKKK